MSLTTDELSEKAPVTPGRTVKTIWPTIALWSLGAGMARLWNRALSAHRFLTIAVGAALAVPAAVLYLWRVRPWACTYYRLAENGAAVLRGLPARAAQFVPWQEVTRIEVRLLPGQERSGAGDIVFFRGDDEALRFSAVPFAPAVAEQARRIWNAQRAFHEILARRAS
ncbi:MAG: hypothetical protein GYA33_13500 [Thermogutta sp.]|nr:hypothetical protein [Thermogutta sp.]